MKKTPKWAQAIYSVIRSSCENKHGTDFGLCSDCATQAIVESAAAQRNVFKRRRRPVVFVKALLAPGKHLVEIVNENKGKMDLWLETAEGRRHMRVLEHGQTILL